MSRLIDADKFKKELSKMEDEYKATLNENCNDDPFSDGVLSALFTIFSIINNQPTAYDVDKVVEALKLNAYDMWICEEQFDMNSPYFKDVPYKMVKLGEAIDVIKVGGIDD